MSTVNDYYMAQAHAYALDPFDFVDDTDPARAAHEAMVALNDFLRKNSINREELILIVQAVAVLRMYANE